MGLIVSCFQSLFGTVEAQASPHALNHSPVKSITQQPVAVHDYTYAKVTRQCITRGPNSHPIGYPLEIVECEESNIYILDVSSQITVDATTKCTLVFGPTEGSIFLRDCHDCLVICAGQQLRLRDCTRLRIFLFAATEPVIETSKDITFSPFCIFYTELQGEFGSQTHRSDHFKKACLHGKENQWSAIFDFNNASPRNYTIDSDSKASAHIQSRPSPEFTHRVGLDLTRSL